MYNSIYPGYVRPYQGTYNQIVKRKEEEESQSSNGSAKNQQEYSNAQNQFPNGQQVAIDYSKPGVNIAQILTDFKNTTSAIGAPDNVAQEVNTYLSLVEAQSQKEIPNSQIIQSNLKNASKILDEYISESLNKPSKVVENWTDALFLQKVDYKADPTVISQDVLNQSTNSNQLQSPKQTSETNTETAPKQQEAEAQLPQTEIQVTQEKTNSVYVPADKQLRKMFIQAKKYSAIGQDEKALDSYKQTLDYAKNIDDSQTQSLVYYEVGQIYDKNNLLPEAIKSYNKAIEKTEDENIKARSHLSMGEIYDDVVQFEPAIDHYFAAISYAGENDNLNLQTKALTNIASMYCNRYDKANTSDYLDLATTMAKETGTNKTIGYVYKQSAEMSERLDENVQALDYYKESTRYYTNAKMTDNIIKNYQSASDIMLKLGDSSKAKNLLQKAYIKAQSTDNTELLSQITSQLVKL